ncbi:putative UDP-N-acetylglucosamine transferase subunit ALG14-like protein [Hypsibius exemplaris]|uniref:UDP-N-acetylglucosamine transferase subunit ALG14 n=1 Tax=Hypsibius exemplaris TaxID=2072580 RepID=A0A1W0WAV7_HYPEX|nr:putative UDP-N-acetylglucosamine transferase subunit ALG14-like protein [Hypsibius exemplaris]
MYALLLMLPILLLVARLIYFYTLQRGRPEADVRNMRGPRRLMVILGSGGHTTEALSLLRALDTKQYRPVTFVLAETDTTSAVRAVAAWDGMKDDMKFVKIPRSREVHQSWLSTLLTTGKALVSAFPIVYREKPDIILCCGPGTCVPICLVAWLFSLLFVQRTVITFVESICRVQTLSLTGKILYFFCDIFFVQYESLSHSWPKAVYLGRLV